MLSQLKAYLSKGSERSVLAKKNVLGSFLNKGVAILISLLLVPMTIGYLDTEQYGVWITISSIVIWISYFDVGLVHGFKNRFAECRAKGDNVMARKYVSTAYAAMAIIFTTLFVVTEIANSFVDWADIMRLDGEYTQVLRSVASVLLLCCCIQLILNVCPAMLTADQRSAFAASITTIGQAVALLVIFILTISTEQNMVYLCWALSGIPCVVLLAVSIFLFRGRYKDFRPSFKQIDFGLVKNIVGLGGKFFLIQMSMLVIFQLTNFIITRVEGAEEVTVYNTAYKYFSITQMLFTIILSPFWAAYTDAYTRNDFEWLRRAYGKLHKIYYGLIIVSIVLLAASPLAYDVWLGGKVNISWGVSVAMCIYLLVMSYSNMFMILINGIGKVFVQMLVYVAFALISIPLLYYGCKEWGVVGVVTVLSIVYFVQAIFAKVQLHKILNKEAHGIWNK